MPMNLEHANSIGSRTPSNIFIVDDDPKHIQLLENIIKSKNNFIFGYTDGLMAIKDAARLRPDLILLDLMMPKVDGFEVCRRLKADDRTLQIPIIFVTSEQDQASESKGFELGAVDYIIKPFDPIVINSRVRTHIELKQHRDSLEQLIRDRTAERDKSQKQFQDLVEKSLIGIAIIENDIVIYQNPELKRTVTNLALKIKEKDFGFIYPAHLAQLKLAYHGILNRTITNVETDIQILSNEGSHEEKKYKWMNCRASVFSYQGRDTLLVNLVDITHTKELEKLLLNRNKMASLGRIASGMAHEIRNPLTGITSYLYSLERICDTQTIMPKDIKLMKEIIDQLKLASHKVEAVIKRVLDFSKPTAPNMVRVDINQCLTNVISLMAVTMQKAGIEVTTALSKKLPRSFGDPVLLEQVFLNLIQNATRALKRTNGEKKIAISSYAHDNDISIAISDSGPGVDNDIKEKIFDPFFTTSSDGSGIGLSIALRIVTDHNGLIKVTDGELGGAHFTTTLPIEKRKYPR